VTGSAAGAEAVILNWRTYKRKEKKTRERLASTAGSAKAGLPRLAGIAGSAKVVPTEARQHSWQCQGGSHRGSPA
jgi:hypothetical protein